MNKIIVDCSDMKRADAMLVVRNLVPVLVEMGGEPLVATTAKAIQDAAKWWS